MLLYPVIMCGGAGTRLWPASRPSRPKQFLPLAGGRSLFQDTALRVAPLTEEGGRLIVVGGVGHRDWILGQLDALGLEAQVLLEPEARDSAPAMAAAAAFTARLDPDGINAFVASDHHIPDAEGFRVAVTRGARAAALGRIVTLGVRPTEPSPAYGYIRPADGASDEAVPVDAFVEKPDTAVAADYIDAGYLWNSGNFITRADVLGEELNRHAPAVQAAAVSALPPADGRATSVLGAGFAAAPRISIDYAVMEPTDRASVLPVDFAWSDLGAWDAVAASGEGERGLGVLEDADGCLIRAADGMAVAVLGARDLAVVAEPDAVLVCDLSRAQDVKRVVDRLKTLSPRHLDFPRADPERLSDGARRLGDWMRLRALPLWAALGQDADGGFFEVLGQDGRVVAASRRARVQPRQIHVFAEAGRLGWAGPWRGAVDRGLARLDGAYLRPDGMMRARLSHDGTPLDETAVVYDQAFLMLAWASAHRAGSGDGQLARRAAVLRDQLLQRAEANGGLVESVGPARQSNPHMHLLEACQAWEAAGTDPAWAVMADRIVELALNVFVDGEGGFLREFFAPDWSPAEGEEGRRVEPGHQFEWAWLLARHGQARGDVRSLDAARRLYQAGLAGVSDRLGAAVDAVMAPDLRVRLHRARLWPQTEWLKAALVLSALEGEDRTLRLDEARAALSTLWRYLTPDGLWRDTLTADGRFIDEPAPASTLYHLMAAFAELAAHEDIGVSLSGPGLA